MNPPIYVRHDVFQSLETDGMQESVGLDFAEKTNDS
jgi:hypothetical protein